MQLKCTQPLPIRLTWIHRDHQSAQVLRRQSRPPLKFTGQINQSRATATQMPLRAMSPSEGRLQSFSSFLATSEATPAISSIMLSLEGAVKEIAEQLASAGISGSFGAGGPSESQSGRDAPKKLDIVANDLLKSAMAGSGSVAAMASEEDEDVVALEASSQESYAAVFDPLDGSSNIDACIPTGTIIGLYPMAGDARSSVMQPGEKQVAAAYALYSSATMLVVSLGQGTYGFTLDRRHHEFVLTHPSIRIPQRGQYYSLNDARQHDWPAGLQKYISNIRQGKGQTGKQYSARYVCSLVADFHRTLLYGGWAANPRSHLRLLYEANPLSFLAEQAGGRGSTGVTQILGIQPESIHQRLPVFLGSPEDIAELESYDDVQQLGQKKYAV